MDIAPGTTVGAVAVKAPFEHEKRFECAAWWEKQTAIVGTYPIVLEKEEAYPYRLKGVANIAAKVTDDYFPALWAGVAVSNKPYKAKHVGESRTIRRAWPLHLLITRTGNSPDGREFDLFLDPKYWIIAQREAEEELRSQYAHLTSASAMGDYDQSLSAMAYSGGVISTRAKDIQDIRRHIGYLTEKGDTWRNYHHLNTKWARDFLGLSAFDVSDLDVYR